MGAGSSREYRAVATEQQANAVDAFNAIAGKVADKLQKNLPNTTDRDIRTQGKFAELSFRLFMSLQKQTEKRGEGSFYALLKPGQETDLEKQLVEGLAVYLIETYRDAMSRQEVIKTQNIVQHLQFFMDGFKKTQPLDLPDLSLFILYNLKTGSQVALDVLRKIGITSFSDLLAADQENLEVSANIDGGNAHGNPAQLAATVGSPLKT